MAPKNKITQLNLQSRALELKSRGESYQSIADILSEDAGQKITKSVVQRYFNRQDVDKARAIEANAALETKVVEAEINTIAQRQEVIERLMKLAKDSEDARVKVQAYKAATAALDSLDERLGKITPPRSGGTINLNNINIENVKDLSDEDLIRIIMAEEPGRFKGLKDRVKIYDAIFEEG